MHVHSLNNKNEVDSSIAAEATDAQMVSRMRLVLAVSAFLAVFIDSSGLSGVRFFAWVVFSGYIVHSFVIWIYSQMNQRFAQSRLVHWLDVLWYALIVAFTDGVHSFFFLFFFFAILTSSFRWGFEEGARVTMASAVLFAVACGLGSATENDLARLLLRTTFLLTLGYMSAHWGGSKVELKRRLALLRDVSRLSNPRFGVDHTITSVLEKTRLFFGASSCILVLRDKESGSYTLRTVRGETPAQPIMAQRISEEMALPLMDALRGQIVAHCRPGRPGWSLFGRSAVYDGARNKWLKDQGLASHRLAELLEARSFISAPLYLRKSQGRIYVLSERHRLRKADALFLSHIGAQAFPVIDTIELVDRMASDAASQERRKIALDIHDTAIQPYIGLKLGLSALRHRATADNPLVDDLDKLVGMAAKVIDDLRRYAGTVKHGIGRTDPMLQTVLRQQAAQMRDFYGIDFTVDVRGEINVSDRLTAEVLQIVQEGFNNICKHTVAQHGSVRLECENGKLSIQIENERVGVPPAAFTPRSITERAAALGGSASVQEEQQGGGTVVRVEIPI